MPGSIAAGDLLLFITSLDGTTISISSSGWTTVGDHDNGNNRTVFAVAKIADGNEGATVTFSRSASTVIQGLCYRITGAHGTSLPESQGKQNFGGADGYLGELSPTWGSADTLWIASLVYPNSISGSPNNYSAYNEQYDYGRIFFANRQYAAAKESVGDSLYWNTSQGGGLTLLTAIRPLSSSSSTVGIYRSLLGVG
jgi:hypothetical protein